MRARRRARRSISLGSGATPLMSRLPAAASGIDVTAAAPSVIRVRPRGPGPHQTAPNCREPTEPHRIRQNRAEPNRAEREARPFPPPVRPSTRDSEPGNWRRHCASLHQHPDRPDFSRHFPPCEDRAPPGPLFAVSAPGAAPRPPRSARVGLDAGRRIPGNAPASLTAGQDLTVKGDHHHRHYPRPRVGAWAGVDVPARCPSPAIAMSTRGAESSHGRRST